MRMLVSSSCLIKLDPPRVVAPATVMVPQQPRTPHTSHSHTGFVRDETYRPPLQRTARSRPVRPEPIPDSDRRRSSRVDASHQTCIGVPLRRQRFGRQRFTCRLGHKWNHGRTGAQPLACHCIECTHKMYGRSWILFFTPPTPTISHRQLRARLRSSPTGPTILRTLTLVGRRGVTRLQRLEPFPRGLLSITAATRSWADRPPTSHHTSSPTSNLPWSPPFNRPIQTQASNFARTSSSGWLWADT